MFLGVLFIFFVLLFLIIFGIGCVIIGFFIVYVIVSSCVGEFVIFNKGYVIFLYLFFYYLGLSIVGVYGGNIW